MRKIRLRDTDGALFDEEMIPQDQDYLSRHKDTFCRMWTEQGREFWERYVKVFRSYILRYSMLGDLTCDASQLQGTLDFAFVVIGTNFVRGKVNQAKNLLGQIADLGKYRHRFAYLDSKSVRKDPFYTRETRDIFREFFGPANEKSSYVRVYLLTPVYMKFGGSIVRCLIKWKDAEEMDPSDDSYYFAPAPLEVIPICRHNTSDSFSSTLCAFHTEDCNNKFTEQFVKGNCSTPVDLPWDKGDPRFCEPDNPLWNPHANSTSDWRDGLTIEVFKEFYCWCLFSGQKPENQCQECRARRKNKKKNKKKKKKKTSDEVVDLDQESFVDLTAALLNYAAHMGAEPGTPFETFVPKLCNSNAILKEKLLAGNMKHNTCSSDSDETPQLLDKHANTEKSMDKIPKTESGKKTGKAAVTGKKQTGKVKAEAKSSVTEADAKSVTEPDAKPSVTEPDAKPSVIEPDTKSSVTEPDAKSVTEPNAKSSVSGATDKGSSKQEKKNVSKPKVLFTSKTVIETKMECIPLRSNEVPLRAHFDILNKYDPDTGARVKIISLKDVIYTQPLCPIRQYAIEAKRGSCLGGPSYPSLSPQYLTRVIEGLPLRFVAEGSDRCVVEVDYAILEEQAEASKLHNWDTCEPVDSCDEDEEVAAEDKDSEKPEEKLIHFVLKIANTPKAHYARVLTVQLLRYIMLRLKRPARGWVMCEDDVFTFFQLLGGDSFLLRGMTITIYIGGTVQDFLIPEELNMMTQRLPGPFYDLSLPLLPDVCSLTSMREDRCFDVDNGIPVPGAFSTSPAATAAAAERSQPLRVNPKLLQTCTSSSNKKEIDRICNMVNLAHELLMQEVKDKKGNSKSDEGGQSQKTDDSKGQTTTADDPHSQLLNAYKSKNGLPPNDIPEKVNDLLRILCPEGECSHSSHTPLASLPAGESEPVDGSGDAGQLAADDQKLSTGDTGQPPVDKTKLSTGDTGQQAVDDQNLSAGDTGQQAVDKTKLSTGDTGQPPVDKTKICNMNIGRPMIDNRYLTFCSNCRLLEPVLRAFKKCSRCKKEGLDPALYYCSRPCQKAHWKSSHRMDHARRQ